MQYEWSDFKNITGADRIEVAQGVATPKLLHSSAFTTRSHHTYITCSDEKQKNGSMP